MPNHEHELTTQTVNKAKAFLLSPAGKNQVKHLLEEFFRTHLLPTVVQHLKELTGERWRFHFWGSESVYDSSYDFSPDNYLSDPHNVFFHFLGKTIGKVEFDIINLDRGEEIECVGHIASTIGVHFLSRPHDIKVSLPNMRHLYLSLSSSDKVEKLQGDAFFVGNVNYHQAQASSNWDITVNDAAAKRIAQIIISVVYWKKSLDLKEWIRQLFEAINKSAHKLVGQKYNIETAKHERYSLSVLRVVKEHETNISKYLISFSPKPQGEEFTIKPSSPLLLEARVVDLENNEESTHLVALIFSLFIELKSAEPEIGNILTVSCGCRALTSKDKTWSTDITKLWDTFIDPSNTEILLPDVETDAKIKTGLLRLLAAALRGLVES